VNGFNVRALLKRFPLAVRLSGILVAASCLGGCSPRSEPANPERSDQANQDAREAAAARKALAEVSKQYYLPAATASSGLRTQLLAKAEAGYTKLIARFPAQTNVAAQAWRNLGNVLAEQDRVSEAVEAYGQVGTAYPTAEWEILQTTKAAADLLWSRGRTNDAVPHYRALVGRYESRTNEAEVIGFIVKGARSRLREAGAER